MRRLLLTALACLAVVAASSSTAVADISPTATTQVTLSCTDGHSVVLWADPATLTSLTAAVQAINAGTSGNICTLDTAAIDPSSETSEWTVYDYNSSGQEIAPRNSPNKMPATSQDGGVTWTFPFKPDVYSALFTTTDPSLTGDDSMKTLSDMISVSGDAATFMTQHGGGDCVGNTPAAVRFYFTAPSASGSSVGTPPAGFYTQFWWSNPVNLVLSSGNMSGTISASMANPADWSDWNGQSGANPAVTEAFLEATQNVQSIGLSFGGECFFETGVTPAPDSFSNETFSSQFVES